MSFNSLIQNAQPFYQYPQMINRKSLYWNQINIPNNQIIIENNPQLITTFSNSQNTEMNASQFNFTCHINYPIETKINSKSRKKSSKNIFTINEDKKLIELYSTYKDDWKAISEKMPNRTLRQCKERYMHYLSPKISSSPWTEKEDELLYQKVQEYGKRWKILESHFPGRTEIGIRNRWNMLERKFKRDLKIQKKNRFLYQKDFQKKAKIIKNNINDSLDLKRTSNTISTNNSSTNIMNYQSDTKHSVLPNLFHEDVNSSNDKSNIKSFQQNYQNDLLQNELSFDKILDVDFNFENDIPTDFFW